MTQKVVDSSLLECETLRGYLSASSNNYAIVPDFVAMEAYKGDTLNQIYSRMAILGENPKQVIVLKATQELCRLSGRAAASQTPLVDQSQTRGFPNYCQQLMAAKRGDVFLQKQLAEHGRVATNYIDSMLLDMKTLASGIGLIAKTYSPTELKILRRREKPTQEMHDKLIEQVCMLAQMFFAQHTGAVKMPKGAQLRNTFIFRYALCGYISILKRIENGTALEVKPDKLRNDVVDMNVAAIATYFDGLLTTDKKAALIHADAEFLLRELFPIPPWRVRIVIGLVQGVTAVRAFLARKN